MTNKQSKSKVTSFRLSDMAESILEELSSRLGISRASVVELALRKYNEIENNGKTKNNN